MAKMFSKIDIGSIRRKRAPKLIKHVIKREVLSPEFAYAMRQARQKVILTAQLEPAEPKFQKNLRPRLKQIASFALAGFILIAGLQSLSYLSSARKASGEILGAATSAYTDLHTAGQNLSTQNFASAEQLFIAAENNIDLAQGKLNNFRALEIFSPAASSAAHVLSGAGFLAEAGKKLTTALNLFEELKVSSKGVETNAFNDKINSNRQLLSASRDLALKAAEEFDAAGSLPMDYSGALDQAKQQVGELSSILKKLISLEDLYLGLLSQQKTYLLIFQNYDEQRATGGFIGTYGVLATNQGSITKLKIESIYELEGQIYEQIAAPGPMQPEIKRWGIRDANWFADFPTTARKLLYFFEKGGETADGVISATPKIFEELLKLTGPVEMDQYGVTLTADNFQQVAQFKTSVDYDKTLNQPKKFLADFAPILLNHLANLKKDQWFEVFQIFEDDLSHRQILLYSKDAGTEKQIEDMGFGGQLLSTDYDYLSINNSNLGGTKTDLNMDQNVNLKSRILSDGSVINTLTIDRKNSADASNKDYLRVLVPFGSQFVSAAGFDDYQYFESIARGMRTDPDLAAWDVGEMHSNVYTRTESGKTEFAGWLNTSVGQTRTIVITYVLPYKIKADSFGNAQSYSLLVQKQAGSKPYHFEGSISLGQFKAKWLGPEVRASLNSVEFQSEANIDDFWPLLITR